MKLLKFIAIFMTMMSLSRIDASNTMCPTPLPEQYQNVDAGRMLVAYVANWDVYGARNYKIEDIYPIAHRLTHIIYAFMKPDDVTGTCQPHDLRADFGITKSGVLKTSGNFIKLLQLKKQFPHLKILLSVGGGTYNKNFIAIAKNPKKLKLFAQSCVDMLDFYDYKGHHFKHKGVFDGLDIDWEWDAGTLTPQLSEAFTEFVYELRRLLQIRKKATKQNALLSVALQVMPSIYTNLNLTALAKAVNWFHVMAYDFFGPWNEIVGFNAPICSDKAIYSVDGAMQNIMEQGLSPAKMVLGLPLYGYIYENSGGHRKKIDKNNSNKAISYRTIKNNYINDPDFEKVWDDFGQVTSLYNPNDRIFISYDGHESMARKVEFAKDKKMQGVVLWRLSGDDDEHTIVHAIADALVS